MKTDKVDGLFVILFGPLILKTVSPLDPHSLMARRNPVYVVWNALGGTRLISIANYKINVIRGLNGHFVWYQLTSEIIIQITDNQRNVF